MMMRVFAEAVSGLRVRACDSGIEEKVQWGMWSGARESATKTETSGAKKQRGRVRHARMTSLPGNRNKR